MENNNQPPIQSEANPFNNINPQPSEPASSTAATVPNVTPVNPDDAKIKRVAKILGILLALLVIGAVIFLILYKPNETTTDNTPETADNTAQSEDEQKSAQRYSTAKDSETGQREQFGSDENKENSGEAFVEYQTEIINNVQSTDEETFDAKLSTAVYYMAMERYSEAKEILNSFDQTSLSEDQQERLANVNADLQILENGGELNE
ncbi:hypothetical protein IK146_00650 [Candidatus Saccharibacteria bacterium]|nr:hypothetical protein [Candidatus Saccharibacteria bacterium]